MINNTENTNIHRESAFSIILKLKEVSNCFLNNELFMKISDVNCTYEYNYR